MSDVIKTNQLKCYLISYARIIHISRPVAIPFTVLDPVWKILHNLKETVSLPWMKKKLILV